MTAPTQEHSDLPEILAHVDPAQCDYSTWVSVGMALKAAGRPVTEWEDWSRRDSARFHDGECVRKWATFEREGNGTVGPGSIVALARAHGWEPPVGGLALGWDDEISVAGYPSAASADVPIQDGDDGSEWDPVGDLREYLCALFRKGEHVGYVVASDDHGRPRGKGSYARTLEDIVANIDRELTTGKPDMGNVVGDWNAANGAWIRINPLSGTGVKGSDVTSLRHVLVESDAMDPARQVAMIREFMLPCAAIVSSAGKSVHAIVRVDAPSKREYDRRVEFLFKWLKGRGYEVDSQNRNPGRLSRMPGVTRSGRRQMLLGTNEGLPTWEAWEEWAIGADDGLPDMEPLASVWDDLPPLSEPLIDGVLRRGHKLLLAGPSKAGKSYALIELAIGIAEGREWLGWQCRRGKVLYVNLELDRASCLHRFRDVYAALGWEPDHLGSIDVWNLRGHAAGMRKIAPRLIHRAAKRGYDLVIIDPIYKVIEGDENSAGDMARFCNAFDEIATSLGCAVAYCHHHSKGYQGQKRSMDRASGSGVFARDPDALLDLSPLDVDEEERQEHVPGAVRAACMAHVERRAPWLAGDERIRTMANADLIRYLETEVMGAEDLKARVAAARTASPWRIEGTLREFPAFEPRNVWFEHPLHRLDDGSLSKAEVAADYAGRPQQKNGERARKARREKNRRQNEAKVAAVREGVAACEEAGIPATRENVLEQMPEVDGRAVTAGQLKRWTVPSSTWCPFDLVDGIVTENKESEG